MIAAASPDSSESVIHGVRIRGAPELFLPVGATRTATAAFEVRFEPVTVAQLDRQLDGELIARQIWDGAVEYSFTRHGHRVEFCFPGFCVGTADLAHGTILISAKTAHDAGLVFPNTVVSAVLGPQPDLVLHASAVSRNGSALAICGPSGAGKSSLAAALALAGYAVMSDDALRVTIDDAREPTCFPGVPELRLRGVRNWALPDDRVRRLPDDRLGYLPGHYEQQETALRAAFFPVVSPGIRRPEIARLRGEAGLRQLLCASRIAWTGPAGAQVLRLLARLHRKLPLYELRLPAPFLDTAEHPGELAALVGSVEGS